MPVSSICLLSLLSIAAPQDGRLLEHWTFDEGALHGVHGAALELDGAHALRRELDPRIASVERISFSAWVRPAQLSSYREIFRQECNERLLFSFQHGGTILALGLHAGGAYVECDAPTDPARLSDGDWHHTAATYDGETMRVFLDGEEIGALPRPGGLTTRADVPGFIGSLGGGSEFFQGELDDLRIYGEALAAKEIGELFRAGRESVIGLRVRIAAVVDPVYTAGASFGATLGGTWAKLRKEGIELDRNAASEIGRRLRQAFPDEASRFGKLTGLDAGRLLHSRDGAELVAALRRLTALLLEYAPLTDEQVAALDVEEQREWGEAEALADRWSQLEARGAEALCSGVSIELLLEIGDRIVYRPSTAEAVAPYVEPYTPALEQRDENETRELLRADWLHQAGGKLDRGRVLDEIRWTLDLARRIARSTSGAILFLEERQALEWIEANVATLDATDTELYFLVRELKRSIALRNPVVDFNRVLLVDGPFPQGSEWPHETRHRLGYMAVPGGQLLVLDGLSPGGRLTRLAPRAPLHGSFWRPDLSFDAHRVLFCFKPHNEKSFHLYEVGIDGEGLTQLTHGPYDDLDPIYLPDGEHFLFSTTRGHTYVRCMPPTNAYVLARCDRDGRNIYLVSRNNEPDYLPSLLHDGRVVYTRWEYTDKPLWRAQGLWSVHPDGTNVNTVWGNQSVWPDLLKDVRAIPGSHRVMFTGSAHHDWFSGAVGILDPAAGVNFPRGLTKVTAELPWPESGNGPVDPVESEDYHASGRYRGYYSPYPLSEQDFLVSANRDGRFVLYLMDVYGNRELIYEGAHNVFHAQPVRPRPRPPVLPDRVSWPDRGEREHPVDGVLFSGDVYHGAPDELRGKAHHLRVLSIDSKTYTTWDRRPYISTGPVVSMVQSEGVKRILGTVPVAPDGSVSFRVPAGKALHFQLLDEDYRALQTMRSFTGVMPGETRGCRGCHAQHSRAPDPAVYPLALEREPSELVPPPWGVDTVSYDRYVQPVLDQHCGECHQGAGEGRATFDLTRRPGLLMFDEPYVTLIGRPTWGAPYLEPESPPPGFGIADTILVEGFSTVDPLGYVTPPPLSRLSYASRLIERASSGTHHGVVVDSVGLRRLSAWIDAMCPYRGEEEVRRLPDPDFPGIDWLSIRPRIATAPTISRPGPVD